MKKSEKLRLCNRILLLLVVVMLLSAVQLEFTHSSGVWPVWVHIGLGCLFMAVIAVHIYLHFGRSDWFAKFRKQKSVVTRILWWLTVIVALSGLVAFAHWLASGVHAPIGGVHGKIGFLMLAFALGHIIKRFRFFLARQR
ncbi:MAG: hypothetical protein K2M19_00840 [Muribaculaceae bacterium]|nr:hypothetical protein [Muribaculaceae bacterium]